MTEYPLHDNDGYLEFVLGLWFHTRHLWGMPSRLELELATPGWTGARREQLMCTLVRTSQVAA